MEWLRHHFGPNRALFVKSVKLGRSILPCILINSGYGSTVLDFGSTYFWGIFAVIGNFGKTSDLTGENIFGKRFEGEINPSNAEATFV